MHFHIKKDETFLISKGKILLNIIYKDGDRKIFTLKMGDVFHIPPGLIHQFVGIEEENYIIEFSTQHFEEDSYRVERGD
jgi:mannose-6-phosphate isomerase-like protein (cupin superfamily)